MMQKVPEKKIWTNERNITSKYRKESLFSATTNA